MASQQAGNGQPSDDAKKVNAATAEANGDSTSQAPLGPDGQPMTKTALKKAAKEAERKARSEAKQALQAQRIAAQPAAEKKEKAKKEVKTEPEYVNNTKPGEKKDLSQPMEAGYNPDHVEQSWFEWWEKSKFFTPRPVTESDPHNPERTFVVPAPPPNVTGALHIGHALTISIQDALVRYHRMKGYRVLFNPGYDHAGIATQAVVEKRIAKTEGKTRHDYGREAFLKRVFDWKDEYQSRIGNQMRRLGASYDFTREAFTMDETRSKAVIDAFCQLHEEGIIYRGTRLVNWCCKLSTTLSNLEVDQLQLNGRKMMNVPGYDEKDRFEFGVIISFAYPLEGSDEKIIVATTRIETMLGDTAIAVHPDDDRYKHLHGKFVVHPFLPDRKIPIVADSIAVDMSFGTGAVKITPAHDPNDYEVGVRHKLPFINILNDDGTLNENAGEFKGMKRFHARRAVTEALKAKGLYVETKDNPMTVPICSRSGDIVEPVIKPQWWVNCTPLAKAAVDAVEKQNMIITPDVSRREFYRWMENSQDWCISRQLWWGHRCPAYLVKVEGKSQDPADSKNWVVGRTFEQAKERAEKLAAGAKYTMEQDEDVLDTWFSSGLWPFSIMGWPEKTDDLKHFYPNSLLETGWDILFFWVARMIMLGVHLTGTIPFKEVFCHAMMSKSLGNIIDPLDIIEGIQLQGLHDKLLQGNLDEKEVQKAITGQKKDFPKGIPQCGTDALRFTLCAYTSAGRDLNLDVSRVEGYRKFCNKLWNATKFALMKLEGGFQPASELKLTGDEGLAEKWILSKLDQAAQQVNAGFKERNFMNTCAAMYNFWLYELCDVYIEATKPIMEAGDERARASAQQTLYTCLEEGLKLLHPFMPYVTEELWQRLPRRASEKAETIALTQFPESLPERQALTQDATRFESVFSGIKAARSLAADYGLQTNLQIWLQTEKDDLLEALKSESLIIRTLVKGCKSLEIVKAQSDVPKGCEALTKKEEFERAPEDVRNGQLEKLKTSDEEHAALLQAKANFESIRDD
ncbi:putative VAS1-valyl-tRNA synthetase [Meira miltonrushii]|uniref:Valine--tRNA ligase, mitochondrial n=1 Tax=Meira miltonrushii TaxID=1280837 RepID=A0A316VK25_9BASI|nr:putative VAS1-valyl-tRNA synthetase [Meira miltonrushii]PWN36663.1 putative VAS1-valyl-tRNA synthetase [Meira miltonrushii]